MQYQILAQKHPEYLGDTWEELSILYRGGYDLDVHSDWKRRLLPQCVGEHPGRYEERLRASKYINYLAQVIDFYGSAVFQRPVSVAVSPDNSGGDQPNDDAYESFAEDASQRGESFGKLLKQCLTNSLICGKAILAVDFPAVPEDRPATRLEEEAMRLNRPYAWSVDPLELIDWQRDGDGTFRWCILHRVIDERESLEASRETVLEQFKLWRRNEQGFAEWRLFEIERKRSERPNPHEDVPEVASGVTSFRRIPIVELALPHGLWAGNKIGPLAKEHFERRSKLLSAISKSLFAIPYVKQGPEIGAVGGALPSEVAMDPHRGSRLRVEVDANGFYVLGSGDEVGFAEMAGTSFKLEADEIRELVNEMFRVGHQMAMSVASTSKALARSGLSKTEDRHTTEIVLKAYGQIVREFAIRVYDTIAEARNENVYWTAYGADKFEIWDRVQIIDEAVQIRDIDIPSNTLKAQYFGKMAERILDDADPQTLQTIREEILAGVAKEAAETESARRLLDESDYGDEEADGDRRDALGSAKAQPKGNRAGNRGAPAPKP
jgi:hypothetical protein